MKIIILISILLPGFAFGKAPRCKDIQKAKSCWIERCELHFVVLPKISGVLSSSDAEKRKASCKCIAQNFTVENLAYDNCFYSWGLSCLDAEASFSEKDKKEVFWDLFNKDAIKLKCETSVFTNF